MESILNQRIKDEKRDLTITEEIYVLKGEMQPNNTTAKRNIMWYKYRCNKCGWEDGYMRRGGLITDKKGCSCCARQTLVVGINDFNTLYPELSELLINKKDGEVFCNSSKKVNIKCKDCGYVNQVSIKSLISGVKCNRCQGGDSYPNKLMKAVLEDIGVEYIREYSPKWVSPKRYDFYIPEKDLILEMNGLQHEANTSFNGRKSYAEEVKKNDLYKKQKAEENNIDVIEIKAYISTLEYIKTNIKISLSKYFDLSSVNWELCELKARKSIIKEICDYKKDNPNSSTGDIAKIYKINQNTCSRYLKIGKEVGWCHYDVEEESKRNAEKAVKRMKSSAEKVVVMEKDSDNILGVFDSALDLEDKSLELFGVLLKQANTRYCCKTKAKRCKGFKVRYYKDVFDTVATTE